MADCPHCSVAIESLPGFVPQATLEERLKTQRTAKDGEISVLKSALEVSNSKASGFDAIVQERDTLKGDIAKRDMQTERSAAMSKAGLDGALLESVELLHTSATAGQDEPQSFADWLEADGKTHPLLSSHFGKPGEPTTTTTTTTTPNLNGPNGNPDINGDTRPPAAPQGRITPDDVRTYLSSPEYNAMNAEDRRTKLAELKGNVETQNTAQA